MNLRPYQKEAVDSTLSEWEKHQSCLITHPTGCGKTVVLAEICKSIPKDRRIMIIAHRHELIQQLRKTVSQVTGADADVEQAGRYADSWGWPAQTVCSSVQTQNAGKGGGRMNRFDPFSFDLLVIDEAHHATAKSYRNVIQHYSANPDLKILGVTATPDRHDREALGQVFDVVSHSYSILDAITDGWLTPIKQRMVYVESMNWSNIGTVAGDLNSGDLAREMEYEAPLHEIVVPSYELTKDRKVLVFCPSVAIAKRMCEMFNRYENGCSEFVCGATPSQERDQIFEFYANDKFRILVNVGVATEGFDCPGIDAVVMARPTQSRALYSQMAGRGMRPFPPALVNDGKSDEDRRTLIAESKKPNLLLVDLVGNCSKHKLVSALSQLGGNHSESVVLQAVKDAENESRAGDLDEEVDPMELLDRAAAKIKNMSEEAKARRSRRLLKASVNYSSAKVSPFELFDIKPPVEYGWDKRNPATAPQLKYLSFLVQDTADVHELNLSKRQARLMIDQLKARMDSGGCTPKQAKLLASRGVDPKNMNKNEATKKISEMLTGK